MMVVFLLSIIAVGLCCLGVSTLRAGRSTPTFATGSRELGGDCLRPEEERSPPEWELPRTGAGTGPRPAARRRGRAACESASASSTPTSFAAFATSPPSVPTVSTSSPGLPSTSTSAAAGAASSGAFAAPASASGGSALSAAHGQPATQQEHGAGPSSSSLPSSSAEGAPAPSGVHGQSREPAVQPAPGPPAAPKAPAGYLGRPQHTTPPAAQVRGSLPSDPVALDSADLLRALFPGHVSRLGCWHPAERCRPFTNQYGVGVRCLDCGSKLFHRSSGGVLFTDGAWGERARGRIVGH